MTCRGGKHTVKWMDALEYQLQDQLKAEVVIWTWTVARLARLNLMQTYGRTEGKRLDWKDQVHESLGREGQFAGSHWLVWVHTLVSVSSGRFVSSMYLNKHKARREAGGGKERKEGDNRIVRDSWLAGWPDRDLSLVKSLHVTKL